MNRHIINSQLPTLFEDLESRLLFSADWQAVVTELSDFDVFLEPTPIEIFQPGNVSLSRPVDSISDSGKSNKSDQPKELVVVDATVEDYQQLIDSIGVDKKI